MKSETNGFLIINKPKGYTSHDVVDIVSKKLKVKCGHTGTLDPIAEGVLVLCLGKATKLSELVMSSTKEYEATVKLGIETDTLDITGNKINEDSKIFSKREIEDALNHFKGTYEQMVPKYSAVKVNGKKLYEYARDDIPVILPKRNVTIYDISLVNLEKDEFTFRCKVSKGTYIRSLIRDICHYLDCFGTMKSLTRLSNGQFNIKDSYTIEDIEKGNYKIIPIREGLGIPIKEVDENLKKKILNGQELDLDYDIVLFTDKDEDLAIYKKEDNKLKIWKMLYDVSAKIKQEK